MLTSRKFLSLTISPSASILNNFYRADTSLFTLENKQNGGIFCGVSKIPTENRDRLSSQPSRNSELNQKKRPEKCIDYFQYFINCH